eukprot:9504184-Pyramimonas_sp.AAC.6
MPTRTRQSCRWRWRDAGFAPAPFASSRKCRGTASTEVCGTTRTAHQQLHADGRTPRLPGSTGSAWSSGFRSDHSTAPFAPTAKTRLSASDSGATASRGGPEQGAGSAPGTRPSRRRTPGAHADNCARARAVASIQSH